MCVVLVFTVKIRTISQLHPFGMFQGLLVRYREPALDIHYDDAIKISDAGIRSCIHITMVQPMLRRICIHAQVRENLSNLPSQNMDAVEHSNINPFCGTCANSGYPDETPHNAASDQGLHCLLTECSITI